MTAPVPFADLGLIHEPLMADITAAWARIAATSAFVGGPDVKSFEDAFAAYCGVEHCVGVANGTDAIELGLRALEIGPGHRVALPANTFIATAEAVARAGAECVMVDCDPVTMLMDPESLGAALARTRIDAVIAVDLYGQIAPIERLAQVAATHGAVLIEDAAQSQGALRHGRGIGHGVALAATSFYPGKNLGAFGDGGAVVTTSAVIAERVRVLAAHGSRVRYHHEVVGMNSRLDTMQAAVLRIKLDHLARWNHQRRVAAKIYDDLLAETAGIHAPETLPGNDHVWHLYPVRVDPGLDRDGIATELQQRGIGVAIHYPVPVHATPAFSGRVRLPVSCEHAERSAATVLSLPMFSGITPEQQQRVVAELVSVVRSARSSEPATPALQR